MDLVKGLRLTAILLVLGLAMATPAEAGPTAAKCEANKLKTTAKYGQCLFKALVKAAKRRTDADFTKCDSKFVGKWAKIEAKGGCVTTDDDTSVAAVGIGHVDVAQSLMPPMSSVSAGSYRTCAINRLGEVECWGSHYNYGDPAPPPLGTFTEVAKGGWHVCGINSSGVVECWGTNNDVRSSPPAGTFTNISAGNGHTCGINSSGTVECWGIGTTDSDCSWGNWVCGQASPPAGTFTEISAGTMHTCGINSAGAVECWGGDDDGQSSPPTGTFTRVSVGYRHTCAINSSGAVECWGAGTVNTGIPPEYDQSSPPAGTFTELSAGEWHTCGINSSGAVECWGRDYYGQSSPPAGTFTEISAGTTHTCGINSAGAVECWGYPSYDGASPPAAPRCWSKPLQLVGKYGSCRLKMDAKAVKKGTNPDYSKCDAKFTDKWARVASKETESCPAIADLESAFQAEVVTYTDDIAAILVATTTNLSGMASFTWYQSYAPCCPGNPNYDPGAPTEECDSYSACDYPGIFAAFNEQMSFEWVQAHNIVAFFDAAHPTYQEWLSMYANKTIRLTKGEVTVDALIVDTCGDADCGGCCTENSQPSGFLTDIEYWTAVGNFGSLGAVAGEIAFEILE